MALAGVKTEYQEPLDPTKQDFSEEAKEFEDFEGRDDPDQFHRHEDYETTLTDYFREGPIFQLRNVITYLLFFADLATGIWLSVQCYTDNHTRFSMSYVMITIATLMYTFWCTVSPRESYYGEKQRNVELVFTADDLKSHKNFNKERDNKVYYCTTSRDVRFKFRLDTTLRSIQGLIFAGRFKSMSFAFMQMSYFMRFHETKGNDPVPAFGNYWSIYYWAFTASCLNFSWCLWLSTDFRYFVEYGGFYHFFWADFCKISLSAMAIWFGSDEFDDKIDLVSGVWGAVLIILGIAMEVTVWEIAPYLGMSLEEEAKSTRKLEKMLGVWYTLFLAYLLFGYFGEYPPLFEIAAMGMVCMTTFLSKLMNQFTAHGLKNIWGAGDEHDQFMYGWILSTETGKDNPTGYHSFEDLKCKIIAFNAATSEVRKDLKKLKNFFYSRAQKSTLHKVTILDLYNHCDILLKERPAYISYWAHVMSMGDIEKPPNTCEALTVSLLAVLAISMFRIVVFALPISLARWHGIWRPELHAAGIAFFIFYISGLVPYVYHLESALIVWHALGRGFADTNGVTPKGYGNPAQKNNDGDDEKDGINNDNGDNGGGGSGSRPMSLKPDITESDLEDGQSSELQPMNSPRLETSVSTQRTFRITPTKFKYDINERPLNKVNLSEVQLVLTTIDHERGRNQFHNGDTGGDKTDEEVNQINAPGMLWPRSMTRRAAKMEVYGDGSIYGSGNTPTADGRGSLVSAQFTLTPGQKDVLNKHGHNATAAHLGFEIQMSGNIYEMVSSDDLLSNQNGDNHHDSSEKNVAGVTASSSDKIDKEEYNEDEIDEYHRKHDPDFLDDDEDDEVPTPSLN